MKETYIIKGNKVQVTRDFGGNDIREYTFIKTSNIDDIPEDYEVWNCTFTVKDCIPMVHTTDYRVDINMIMYALDVHSEVLKEMIMDYSMRKGKGKHKDAKEQLDIVFN